MKSYINILFWENQDAKKFKDLLKVKVSQDIRLINFVQQLSEHENVSNIFAKSKYFTKPLRPIYKSHM